MAIQRSEKTNTNLLVGWATEKKAIVVDKMTTMVTIAA